eukprot:COSAG02_NODE_944_length_15732_cov_24.529265_4_plen_142_part_00
MDRWMAGEARVTRACIRSRTNSRIGRHTGRRGGNGTFAVHPTQLLTRPLKRFYHMLWMTRWTMSLMIGTVARQHPLVDIDFHDGSLDSIKHLFTDQRLQHSTDAFCCAATPVQTPGVAPPQLEARLRPVGRSQGDQVTLWA